MLAQAFFPEQVSTDTFVDNLLYILAATAVVLVVAALILVDLGIVKRRNVLDTSVQRLVGFLIGTISYVFIGYGIWNWQFYDAFAVSNPYGQAIEDWWIGGHATSTFAQDLDPAFFAGANTLQIFIAFLALYAGFICVLIHFAGAERLKASAYYIMCAGIGGIAYPIVLWLTWGSTSPLTNAGVHDFVGIFVAYIFAGTFCLMLARRLGPRAGLFKPHPVLGERGAPYNLGITTVGVVLLLFAIPFVVIGCGYFFPDAGYFGISMTTSGLGVVFNNIFIAYVAGGVVGALIAYRTKHVVHALLGPLAGYVAGTAAFDVVAPWQMFLIALVAPLLVWLVYNACNRYQIDESKVIPLGLGAGIYGAIVVGFAQWHEKTGGFIGIEEGKFAFQNSEITPYWQLVGVGVTMGIAVLSGLVLIWGLDKVMGLRVSDEEEVRGLDPTYWHVEPAGADLTAVGTAPGAGGAAPERPLGEP